MFRLILSLLLFTPCVADDPVFLEVPPYEAGMFDPAPAKMRAVAVELLALGENDHFAEIGCGDGRVLVDAMINAPESCTAVGFEIEPSIAAAAQARVRSEGLDVGDRVRVYNVDARLLDLKGFTAVYVYLPSFVLEEIAPKLKGKRVVSVGHEIPGLTGGEKFANVWLYRGGRAPTAPAAPPSGSNEGQSPRGKPQLTIVLAPKGQYCPGCEILKADIAAGKLSDYDIVYASNLETGGYPEIRYTNKDGNKEWINGWPSWTTLQSAFTHEPQQVAALPPTVRVQTTRTSRTSSPVWTWKGGTYPVFEYSRCNWAGCPMCAKWERIRAQY